MDDADRDTVCVTANGLALEIDIVDAAVDPALPQVIAAALRAANEVAGPRQGCVTVLVTNDERLQELNRTWRGLDKPTNVLSFAHPAAPNGLERYLGDIAISHETAAREAVAECKSLDQHIAHLSVHGFLHLLGYDHISDDAAAEMEGLERVILARIGVPDPYIAHDAEG
jgi:probable rRNA maturation factor